MAASWYPGWIKGIPILNVGAGQPAGHRLLSYPELKLRPKTNSVSLLFSLSYNTEPPPKAPGLVNVSSPAAEEEEGEGVRPKNWPHSPSAPDSVH